MKKPPAWRTELPSHTQSHGHKIWRCPQTRSRPYVILSDQPLLIAVHWSSGRSVPCTNREPEKEVVNTADPQCVLCLIQHPQWKGYLCVFNPDNGERGIHEFTPPCIDALGAYRQLYGTLRGATITFTRKGLKENGRLSCTLHPSGIPLPQLPEALDVEKTVQEAWDAPSRNERIRTTVPRDTSGGNAELNALKAQLQKMGIMTTSGELIEPKAQEPQPPEELPAVKFKVDPAYKATPAQLAMLEANRNAAAAAAAATERVAPTKSRLDKVLKATNQAFKTNGRAKKNGAPQP